MPCTYERSRPALTVDCVIFALDGRRLKVLLIQRDADPFAGMWALPGGFVHVDEGLEGAARRELAEEAGVHNVFLEQLYTFGEIDRDPRQRVVSVAYYALVRLSDHRVRAATDARDAGWFAVEEARGLAFDHDTILGTAHRRLRTKIRYRPIGFELLPPKFPLRHLQEMYEAILGRKLDKRNFRRKMLAMDILEDVGEAETGVPHRAARLYRFDKKQYDRKAAEGFSFEI